MDWTRKKRRLAFTVTRKNSWFEYELFLIAPQTMTGTVTTYQKEAPKPFPRAVLFYKQVNPRSRRGS